MHRALRTLGGLAAGALLAVAGAAGCSSERSTLTLEVRVAPNPVTGVDAAGGRSWEFEVAITNPNAVGVYVENFHAEITDTDTGYEQPLVLEQSEVLAGRPVSEKYIPAGGTLTYSAGRDSEGRFARAQERRIYNCIGADGVYYSGEVLIELQ